MSKKRSKGSSPFKALLILCGIAFGLWWLLQGQTPATTDLKGHKYQVRKTGASVIIDFTNAARELDTAVLKVIKDSGYKHVVADRMQKETPRTQVEGRILWEHRRITIAIPSGTKTGKFEEDLLKIVQKANGRIFSKYAETIEGKSALRINIGFADDLEGEPVMVVTHNIWLITDAEVPSDPPQTEKNTTKNTEPADKPSGDKPVESKVKGRLALVIDDFGLTMEGVDELLSIDRPLTFAILPYHAYSVAIAREAAAHNKQVMLHLPMEPLGGANMEATTILTSMTDEQIKARTREAMAAMPEIKGVNNHQGSKATADSRVMKAVLAVVREKRLFFVDSHTSSETVAYRTAKTIGIPTAENDHFIDNVADVEAIKAELRVAGNLAIQDGSAVAIGHIRPHTVIAIQAMLPELDRMGVKLVYVSELLR